MDDNNTTQNPDPRVTMASQIPPLDFSQCEEIFQEYQKNRQQNMEEFMEGINELLSEMGKLHSDLVKASMREGRRMENLNLIRSSCCKITQEYYTTIRYHFKMPLFKKFS